MLIMVVGSPTGFVWMEVIQRIASGKTFSKTQQVKRGIMSHIMLMENMSHKSRFQGILLVIVVLSLGFGMETQPWRTIFSSTALTFQFQAQAQAQLGAVVPSPHAVVVRLQHAVAAVAPSDDAALPPPDDAALPPPDDAALPPPDDAAAAAVVAAASLEEAVAIAAMTAQDGVTFQPQIAKHAQAHSTAMVRHPLALQLLFKSQMHPAFRQILSESNHSLSEALTS
jgi:hypothetical protein